MKLILFDIDGTILWTDGAGRRAIRRALLEELGTAGPIDAYRLDGKTDPQIVRELLELAGHPAASDERAIAAVCDRYVALLTRELESPTQRTRLLDGVAELLAALAPHEAAGRALVGLLTGNLERGAALKLRSAGLDPARFAVGAYGSDSGHRPDLPAIAAGRAAQRTGRPVAGGDVVIIGDTPADVACGRPIGARTVAVATGSYDAAALKAAGAAHVFATLADPAAVERAVTVAGAEPTFRGEMIDRRFDRGGTLEAQDEVLRLRIYRPADGGVAYGMLGWKGPKSRRGAYRHREEWETRVADPEAVLTMLDRLGFAV